MAYRHHIGAIGKNRALRVLLLSNSLVLVSLAMLVPVYALFVEQVGGSALSAGFTAGSLGIASAISALVSGKMVDRLSPAKTRIILVAGWTMISAVMLLYLFVDSLAALYIVQILAGFVKTVSAPAFDALYARHLDKAAIGQEYGIWEASFFLTAGVGAMLGGLVVNSFGFDGLFIAMSGLGLVAATYVLSLPKNLL